MVRRAVLLPWLVACGFHHGVLPGDGGRGSDAGAGDDASKPPLPYVLGCSIDVLYRIDVDTGVATMVGTMSRGTTTFSVDGLAGDDTLLYAIPASHDRLLQLDPATAAVTTEMTLSPVRGYWGLTLAPPGEAGPSAVLFAASNGSSEIGGGHLFVVDPATGTATPRGAPFGNGMTIEGDIAWVRGSGLYGSFHGGTCSPLCIAKIDPATGVATVLAANAADALHGMSGYRDRLWAFDGSGRIFDVDLATGATTLGKDTGTINWYDAAQ